MERYYTLNLEMFGADDFEKIWAKICYVFIKVRLIIKRSCKHCDKRVKHSDPVWGNWKGLLNYE